MPNPIGYVSQTSEVRVEWCIHNFLTRLSQEKTSSYESSSFDFSGMSWNLRIDINNKLSRNSGWLSVYLVKKTSRSVHHGYAKITISLKTSEGIKDQQRSRPIVLDEDEHGFARYLIISEIIEKQVSLMPSGVLTIICCLSNLVPGFISRTEDLSRDLESLIGDRTRSDVTFRVEGEEFYLHRNVLAARSPVFDAMFRHDMSENVTGLVPIEDCRLHVFRIFVRYLYTGKVEAMSSDDVFDLYRFADKYQEEKLADECVFHVAGMLTVETFCDAVELAFDRDYKFLLGEAIKFFLNNKGEIVRTKEWRKFLSQNPDRANDILEHAFPK